MDSLLDFRLLNDWQHDFPLVPRPFESIAHVLKCDEKTVLARYQALQTEGVISRIGAVFAPNTVGVSTLAALKVPREQLTHVARLVSAQRAVNHNYAREHLWNLWFVVTASDTPALEAVLSDIQAQSHCPLMRLPLEKPYHIDLGFDLSGQQLSRPREKVKSPVPRLASGSDSVLIAHLSQGLHLEPRPFQWLAQRIQQDEAFIRQTILDWCENGVIKRFGVVVRHHALGYRANAMCVWNVPNELVDCYGERLARLPGVTLCYRRARASEWPYNLYCMIHGQSQSVVRAWHHQHTETASLKPFAGEVLFSTHCFKQTGARYREELAR